MDGEIQNIKMERIRLETKVDAIHADQLQLLQKVLTVGGFLFVSLLVAARYFAKKLEPLLLSPALVNGNKDAE